MPSPCHSSLHRSICGRHFFKRKPISEEELLFEVAYVNGCLEAERSGVDSLQIDMIVVRGRLVTLSSRAVRAEAWVRRCAALEPEVNDEDEKLVVMRDLMDNLMEIVRLVLDLQGANDEVRVKCPEV